MKPITATFKHRNQIEHAVNELIGMGVDKDEISVLMSDDVHRKNFASEVSGAPVQGVKIQQTDRSEEGTAAGAAAGGAFGAILASVASVGILGSTGLGLVAAGPVMAVMAGAGGGGMAGGVIGFLTGMGVEKHEVKTFADRLENGAFLLSVESDKDTELLKKVLKKNGGEL
jgi:hypothetical protein